MKRGIQPGFYNGRNQVRNQISRVESAPTNEIKEANENRNVENAKASKVPIEQNKFQQLINFFSSNWGVIAALVPILSWGIYLQYDVSSAKQDIEKNTIEIKDNENKIVEIDKSQVGYEKELGFIKQMYQTHEGKVSSMEETLKKIEIEHALQSNGKRKAK